jgi:pimeloyl-ACP methyl ester carboxylesterase
VVHPRTGLPEDVEVSAGLVASVLFNSLYSPVTGSIVPTLVERAEQGDFQSLFALALANEDGVDNMSLGMQLSVLCSEDASRITRVEVSKETSGTIFGFHLLGARLEACSMWPKGKVDDGFFAPVVSDVPTLVLSGDIDPVTPPGWGESVVKHLSRGRHITAPGTGHGVVTTPCGNRLVSEFIDSGSVDNLDTECIAAIRRPPFFVTPAGPAVTAKPAGPPAGPER